MTTKFFKRDKFKYQKLNDQGEYEYVSSKERKQMEKRHKNCVKYPDNDIFLYVTKGLKEMFEDSPEITFYTKPSFMTLDYMTYQSNVTSINSSTFCLNLHPRAKSLDITRVWVHPDAQGKGLGTHLMELVMLQIMWYTNEKKQFPKIVLECCGSVGTGANFQETPVEDQIRFFSKFGFEIDRIQGQYHHMVLTLEGLINYVKNYNKNLVVSE